MAERALPLSCPVCGQAPISPLATDDFCWSCGTPYPDAMAGVVEVSLADRNICCNEPPERCACEPRFDDQFLGVLAATEAGDHLYAEDERCAMCAHAFTLGCPPLRYWVKEKFDYRNDVAPIGYLMPLGTDTLPTDPICDAYEIDPELVGDEDEDERSSTS